MFPDNAALELPYEPEQGDEFMMMTDRELLEYNARTLASILAIANQVKEQVGPVVDSIGSNPMLKMLIGKR